MQLGIGVAMYVELSAASIGFNKEFGSVEVLADGTVRAAVGTAVHGQGHKTIYSQIIADELGVRLDQIEIIQADTGLVPEGMGTGESRSAQIGGTALKLAAEAVTEKAKRLTAHLLEAAAPDIELVPGHGLGVRGVPSSAVSWADLADVANDARRIPDGMTPKLFEAPGFEQVASGTAPNGCHVAVVEIDTETGAVELRRIVAIDDCGVLINPMLVEGQVHGGLLAGIAQALFEEFSYDPDGNPLTTTFADYLFPSAPELPWFETGHVVTPTPHNALGGKGVGEAGTTGSIAAVQNAVVDAISHLGIRHIDLPPSPLNVWSALRTQAISDDGRPTQRTSDGRTNPG